MARQYFMPNSEDGKAAAFEQFRDNIGPYVATFGLAAADITQQAADADYFRAALTLAQTMGSAGNQWTAWKSIVLTGTNGSEPALPAKPAGFPPAPPAGILTRFLALARTVKNHKNYTTATGDILGLEGAEQTGPDMATIQPNITATPSLSPGAGAAMAPISTSAKSRSIAATAKASSCLLSTLPPAIPTPRPFPPRRRSGPIAPFTESATRRSANGARRPA